MMIAIVTENSQNCVFVDPENLLFYSRQYRDGVKLLKAPEPEIGQGLEMQLQALDPGVKYIVRIERVVDVIETSIEILVDKGFFERPIRLAR